MAIPGLPGLRRASSPAGWDQDKAWTEELTVSGVSLPAAQIPGVSATGQRNLLRLTVRGLFR